MKKVYAKTLHIPIWGNACYVFELYTFPSQVISIKVLKGVDKLMEQDVDFDELVAIRDAFNEIIETYQVDTPTQQSKKDE